MNIAIFGGSFDPPHVAHLQIIDIALRQLDIGRLFVVVAYQNPFKKSVRNDSQTRFKWLKEICESFSLVECSDFEIKQNKPTPSIQTVRYFKKTYKPDKIYFIIGEDNLYGLKSWNNFSELNSMVEFVVFHRSGFNELGADLSGINMRFINFKRNISSTIISNNPDKFISQIPSKIRDKVYNILKRTKMPQNGKADIDDNAYANDIKQTISDVVEILDSKKSEDIICVDMEGSDYICNFVIIATTLAKKHALSLLDNLKDELKPKGVKFFAVDSDNEDWIIIDIGEIIIHLLTKEHRDRYKIEDFLEDFKLKEQ